jgi:hypothetical protein
MRLNCICAIRGLVSRPELNGSRCVVTGHIDVAKSRWPVRIIKSGEQLLIREGNLFIEETMSDGRYSSTDADSNYAAQRALINASLNLRQGVTVEGPADSNASAPGSRADRIRLLVHHLGHELSSSHGVKFIVNSAGGVRLVATRDIPRGTAILQLPHSLRFSISDLSVESGIGNTHLRERVHQGISRVAGTGPVSYIERRFTVCDPAYFLQVCQIIAARHKLQDVSTPPSSLMRMYAMLFDFKAIDSCIKHLHLAADFNSTMKRCR